MNAADSSKEPKLAKTELATFGGGCFWCVEAAFETFKGVRAVTSGYAGGKASEPTYEQVCTGKTGHAEVVQVEFDPTQISYEQLLEIFWEAHDPTTLYRQGADVGTQYRSIILTHDESQKRTAEKSKEAAQKKFPDPIVTEIAALTKFYPAEEHHQDYFQRRPNAPYCAVVISPKLKKLQKMKHALERN
ncbi:MAG: peptide-methionine (S)-S-oxide reductase MsrA [Verrucomicrobiales bacterium]|nr:peptide-methionine (S)-S-oxide reductase MsrA [Verrucomicrobiales bacterium]